MGKTGDQSMEGGSEGPHTYKNNTHLRAAAEASRTIDAKRRRRSIFTMSTGKGMERKLKRVEVEVWWERLRQRTQALAIWAKEVRSESMGDGM